jgi:hypothetical protein
LRQWIGNILSLLQNCGIVDNGRTIASAYGEPKRYNGSLKNQKEQYGFENIFTRDKPK